MAVDLEGASNYSRLLTRGAVGVVLALWLAWIWGPLVWDFFTGLSANPQTTPPTLLPDEFTFEHYRNVVVEEGMPVYIRNSVVVTAVATGVSVVVGALAAYALTRYDPGDGQVSFFILSMRFLPPIAVAIPIYMMFVGVGWINTWRVLIIAYLPIGIPISTWIMLIFFQRIPMELEEASRVDGWSRIQTWRRVVLPLAAPGISSAAILTAILMWNEYVLALVLTTTQSAQTIPIYLAGFVTTRGILWGRMGAATIIAITPIVILAFLAQERLVAGFTLE
ncbi:carbohydrate ABC transporter permease [Candidatus Halobonum tyrrellensis]|uniref:Putative ABC transporter permease protein yurM n=1 Tax=Candidatus Halobonum tyrrellensis G22 TaxID=1324957 RepID=V4GQQ4_9EURY|nr:carbohydrate ABC transporter permease [Candidatus Halobonum tyrrellensis]ESP87366.1 putative ABC transporter permease protein yurM [Candidatus Halobonum tyrrellensis G22]